MEQKAWVIAVDMGYGHQRAAYPLKDIAFDRIINANSDKVITPKEKRQWQRFKLIYEGLSRVKSIPFIGKYLWSFYDKLQEITPLYPFRDLSKPNINAIILHRMISKGFLSSLVDYTKSEDIPFVSTFFAPPIAAAYHKIKEVYCIVTDTDLNRIWVSKNPKRDKLCYLTPTEQSKKRLIEYGVPEKNIFFTGFPLPKENLGENLEITHKDLGKRLINLDPQKKYLQLYEPIIKEKLGDNYSDKPSHVLTITYTVGGAGAQKEIGIDLLKSLKNKIKDHEIRLNLVAGTRLEVKQYFEDGIKRFHLEEEHGKFINILFALDKKTLFAEFNEMLHETDVLWTKPSELVFYTALGIPIIITPPVGSHEHYNRKWLRTISSGLDQEEPKYANEWLFDWIKTGRLAEAAWEGYLKSPKYGIYNIEKIIFAKDKEKINFEY